MIKFFAHRGFVINQKKENSIESLDFAVENNFDGVEFDVWFLDNLLVLSHDNPDSGKFDFLPKFSDYLKYGNKIEYWIDFKNLQDVDFSKAIEFVKKEIENSKINLEKIFFAPFITDLKKALPIYKKIDECFESAQIMAVCDEIEKEDLEKYYQNLKENNIKFLSVNHKNIDENFVKIFSDIEVFAWTVNDFKRLQDLQKLGIKNFASDKKFDKKFDKELFLS